MGTLCPPFLSFHRSQNLPVPGRKLIRVSTAEAQTQGPPQVGGDAQRDVESLLAVNIKGLFLPEDLAKGVDLLKD